jgi:hypothetical protein
MSLLADFYTYEVMSNATVEAVSTEVAGHPAEHAISPLEPNFAWQANQASTQHTLTVDLGATYACGGFTYMHHEVESDADPVSLKGIDITVASSDDGSTWTAVTTAYNSDGTNVPDDRMDGTKVIKLRHFVDGAGALLPRTARYWKFTVKGMQGPSYYPTTDCRINMLWLCVVRQLDRGSVVPTDDAIAYPTGDLELAYGKVYRTGYSVNPYTAFSRTWMLTDEEYAVLCGVMQACNGSDLPFVLSTDGERRLCKFAEDEVDEELLDVGLRQVTCKFVTLPIVGKDEYH